MEKWRETAQESEKAATLAAAQEIEIAAPDPGFGIEKQAFRMATRRRVAPFDRRQTRLP